MTIPELPAGFLEQQKDLLPPEEFSAFVEAFALPAPVSLRFNPFKCAENQREQFLRAGLNISAVRPVPWCDQGVYLLERPSFTIDPLFHAGTYYVQEASSMFVGWLASRLHENYTAPRILDLCAAPGGKTTHLAAIVGKEGVIVANEVIRSRANILAENVKKWGTGNIAVTSNDPEDFGKLPEFFDIVLVDAPCSGEGMFRKDPAAREEWSPENVALCAARQRRIVSHAWKTLREGGALIYSTCTFNKKENEENVRWIAEKLGGEILRFDNIPEGAADSGEGYRFYPHKVKGEGFFAAVIRKNGDAPRLEVKTKRSLPEMDKVVRAELEGWAREPLVFVQGGETVYGFGEHLRQIIGAVRGNLNLIYSGVAMGEMIRGALKPSHPLALYYGLDCSKTSCIDLDMDKALSYLRRDEIDSSLLPQGLSLVTFSGVPLGWVKRIGRRNNNLYPTNWRILMPKKD